ncbi:hypothetical protein MMC25_007164 [Agyrium rufum]|nr:hypothetical protein [Agyrium rufum]
MTTYIPSLTLPSQIFASPVYSIGLPLILGIGVGYSVRPSSADKTYLAIRQPPFRPPPFIFGPAWTVLYGLMGYSAHRAYVAGITSLDAGTWDLVRQGTTLYTLQLGLNLIWMPLFFGLKRPIEATADIVLLTALTGYLTYTWGQVDTIAGWALVPYLGWLGFATYLTIGAGYLNNWSFEGKEKARGAGTAGEGVTKFVNEGK